MVASWFQEIAAGHGQFDASLVDLKDFDLPVFDEPEHPRLQRYVHEHTRRWAASVSAADAFVFVTPEYNFGPPPALLNALNYLYLAEQNGARVLPLHGTLSPEEQDAIAAARQA